jgi:hypothetical protein
LIPQRRNMAVPQHRRGESGGSAIRLLSSIDPETETPER